MTTQPSREDPSEVLLNPLSYITPDQRRAYRKNVIRKAFLFIATGVLTLFLYSYLYNKGINIDALSFQYPGKPIFQRSYEAYGLTLYGLIFVCPIYGLYLLATTKRQMAKSAVSDLAIQNANIRERLNERSFKETKDLNNKVNRATSALTKIFMATIAIVILFTFVVIGLALTGKLSDLQ